MRDRNYIKYAVKDPVINEILNIDLWARNKTFKMLSKIK